MMKFLQMVDWLDFETNVVEKGVGLLDLFFSK